ncbi:MAG TPA: hypothetical protein VFB59_00420 [Candidatus Saccharimonadales bacterium]|nr:hypothetical protein [Candidatus Saccharimonadales bacterium]
MVFAVIGILSAILFLVGDYSYFRDTLKGKTVPQRVTWGVAFLLNSIGFANQYASGASNSLWLFGAAVLATGAIFGASIFKGVGGYSKLDIFAIAASVVGVALWVVFDSPVLSIISTLIVVIVSMTPTIIKAKKHPESETRIAWLLGAISAFMAVISVGELNWMLLILPLNAAIIQLYIAYLLYVVVKKHREVTETPVHGPASPLE